MALAPDAAVRQGGQGRGEIIADMGRRLDAILRDLRIIKAQVAISLALSIAILFLV